MNDEQQIIEPVPTMAGYKKIPTFKLWIANQFPYIETDFDAITNYELLQAVIKYLNTIIENENNVESNVTALYNAFVNLHDYVENFFDNLDVQEEINNKLDEMVEDGTLESLLLNYTQITKVFDTYIDMMLDTSTYVNGMKLKTLGYHYINDGGGADYIVTNVQSDTKYQVSIGTNLWVEMIIKDSVNVKQFGAYGDGQNDDTQAIKNSLLKSSNIYLPKGDYLLNDSLMINSYTNLYGDGDSSKIKAGNELYHMIYIINSQNINIHDLCLTGNAHNRELENNLTEAIYGLSIDFSKNIIIDNITFTDMGFTANPEKGGNMLSLNVNETSSNNQSTENCIIKNCKFIDPEARSSFGIRVFSPWDITNERQYYVKNNKIENCYFTGLSYNGIELAGPGCVYNIINNNIFEDMKCIICLEADKGASYNHYTNNVVKNLNCLQNQSSFAYKDGSSGLDNTQSVGNIWIGNSAYNVKQNVSGASGGFQLVGAKDTIISNLIIDNIIPHDSENQNSVGIYIGGSDNNNSENIQINNSKIKNISSGNGIQILTQYCKDININNNEINNARIGFRTTTTTSLGNITLNGNSIINSINNGININTGAKIQIENNYIKEAYNGININDSALGTIINNIIDNVEQYSIRLNGDNTNFYVANNKIKKPLYMPQTNTLTQIINNNITDESNRYVKNIKYGTAIPVSGNHYVGDIIYNTTPTGGGNIGWVCVTEGNPGTWKSFGAIEN